MRHPHPIAATILRNERHPRRLQCRADRRQVIGNGTAAAGLEVGDCDTSDVGRLGELVLAPAQQAARGAALSRGDGVVA